MKINRFQFNIRTTILSTFFVIIGLLAVVSLALQYYFSTELANKAVNNTVKYLSDKTLSKLNSIDKFSFEHISLLTLSSSLEDATLKRKNKDMLQKFVTIMSHQDYIYAMYVGQENGDFYEVINLNIDPSLRIKYKSPQDERWLVVKIITQNNKRIKIQEYLDSSLRLKRTETILTSYNPVKRPWYKKALQSKNMIKTDLICFPILIV